jgi:hypothetical protein
MGKELNHFDFWKESCSQNGKGVPRSATVKMLEETLTFAAKDVCFVVKIPEARHP